MRRVAFFVGALLVVACGGRSRHYYVVRDLSGGQIYYTNDMQQPEDGPLKLTDAKTRQVVTVPNHTIQEISKAEFDAQVGPAK